MRLGLGPWLGLGCGAGGNCDGGAAAPTWYRDADGDGYGDPGQPVVQCAAPKGLVANNADCDDSDPSRNPSCFASSYLDLAHADARLVGKNNLGEAGSTVSGAGDLNADGFDDILVGAPFTRFGDDCAYIVHGPVTGTLDLALAEARLIREDPNDQAGVCLSGAGDLNADGFDDILVGAPGSSEGGIKAGATYVLLGASP